MMTVPIGLNMRPTDILEKVTKKVKEAISGSREKNKKVPVSRTDMHTYHTEEKTPPTNPQPDPMKLTADLSNLNSVDPDLLPYLSYPRPEIPDMSDCFSRDRVSRTPAYEVFSQSVIGKRHIDEGMNKEDNCCTRKDIDKGVWAFALGDGHGDPNCVRSSIGSDLVSQIAVQKLMDLEEGLRLENRTGLLRREEWQEILMRQVILSIKTEWDRQVLSNYREHPLTEEEWEQCNDYRESYRNGKSLEHIYGTTLIAGLATKEYLVLLQQGDGRCDVFHADGSVDQPIPWDDDCVGNATTSMCQSDTWKRCRYCVIDLRKDPVIACFAGSDGVEDSFRTMDDVHAYYRGLLIYAIDHDIKSFEQYLDTELKRLNWGGSMDDTTVVGVIDSNAAQSLRSIYYSWNEAYRLLTVWNYAEEALRSKGSRKEFLRQKYAEVKQKFDILNQNQTDIFRYYDAEQFAAKMEQADLNSQNITGKEYDAARWILENWLNENARLRGKRDDYIAVQNELEKRESEYRDCYNKYVELQCEKAKAARNFENLIAQNNR